MAKSDKYMDKSDINKLTAPRRPGSRLPAPRTPALAAPLQIA